MVARFNSGTSFRRALWPRYRIVPIVFHDIGCVSFIIIFAQQIAKFGLESPGKFFLVHVFRSPTISASACEQINSNGNPEQHATDHHTFDPRLSFLLCHRQCLIFSLRSYRSRPSKELWTHRSPPSSRGQHQQSGEPSCRRRSSAGITCRSPLSMAKISHIWGFNGQMPFRENPFRHCPRGPCSPPWRGQ
jgi:hypothetical protein